MQLADGLLGAPLVSRLASAATQGRLRVLAFHGVADRQAFARVLDIVAERYTTVTGPDVTAWLAGNARLPRHPVWITFDDGSPDVVSDGLELLRDRGMTATLFVCPGLVDTAEPYWWEITQRAIEAGIADATVRAISGLVSAEARPVMAVMKDLDDDRRRAAVEALRDGLRSSGIDSSGDQLTTSQIRSWTAAGNEVGNHSWDHPCLDRCPASEQERQVRNAHEWLCDNVDRRMVSFAWPNGNHAAAAAREVRRLGYGTILRFDHRLVARRPDPWALSRLRIDSNADTPRVRAILSGLHSGLYQASRPLRATRNRSDGR